MKAVRIFNSYFETNGWGVSLPVFEAGKTYPINEASERQVALRNGEVIDVPDDVEKAEQAAESAEVRAEKAAAAAQAARDAADAAAAVAAAAAAAPADEASPTQA